MMPVKRKKNYLLSRTNDTSRYGVGLFLVMGTFSVVVLSIFFMNENQDVRRRAMESYPCTSHAQCGPSQLCQKNGNDSTGSCVDENLFPTAVPTATLFIPPQSLAAIIPTQTPIPEKVVVVVPKATEIPPVKIETQTTNIVVIPQVTTLPKTETVQTTTFSDSQVQMIQPTKEPDSKKNTEVASNFYPEVQSNAGEKTNTPISQNLLSSVVESEKSGAIPSFSDSLQTVAVSSMKSIEPVNTEDITKKVTNLVATNIAFIQQESGSTGVGKENLTFITDTDKGIQYHEVSVPISEGKIDQEALNSNIVAALESQSLNINPKVIEVVNETQESGKSVTSLTASSIKYAGGNIITCTLGLANCPLSSIRSADLAQQLTAVQSTSFCVSVNSPNSDTQKAGIGSIQNVSVLSNANGDLLIEQKAGKAVSASLASAFLFAPISEQLPVVLKADTVQVSEPIKPVMDSQQQRALDTQLITSFQSTGHSVVKETKDVLLIQTLAEQLGFQSAMVQTESGKGFFPVESGPISPEKLNEATQELLNASQGNTTLAAEIGQYKKANPLVQLMSSAANPGIDKLSSLASDDKTLEVVTIKVNDIYQQASTYDLQAQSSQGQGSPVKMILMSDTQGNVAVSLKAEEFASENQKAKVEFFNQQLNGQSTGFENLLIQKISR
jgi:hypothetical protein